MLNVFYKKKKKNLKSDTIRELKLRCEWQLWKERSKCTSV